MNDGDRTFVKTVVCIFALIYFGMVDAAKRGLKWLAALLPLVALVLAAPARADAPLIWGASGPQLIQSGSLTAKDGSVYPKYYEKNYLAAGASSIGAAASPVWHASGAGITCTTTVTNLPDASVGTALAVTGQSGAAGTEYCFYNFDIDQADGSKVLKLVEDQLPISGYVASDFRLDVYSCTVAWSGTPATTCSGTATRLALSTDNSSGVTALPALTGTLTPPPTYSTPAYASAPHLQARIGLNGASTHQMNFAQILTGPGTVVQSAAVTQETVQSGLVFNSAWGTVTNKGIYSRRVGNKLHVRGTVVVGTPTSGILFITLPTGLAIDTSLFDAQANAQKIGWAQRIKSSGTTAPNDTLQNVVFYDGSDPNNIFIAVNQVTSAAIQYDKSVGTAVFNAGDIANFDFEIPIAQWAGQGTVFLGQGTPAFAANSGALPALNATDTTNYVYGPAGTPVLNYGSVATTTGYVGYRVNSLAPISATFKPVLEFSTDGIAWFDAAQLGLGFSGNSSNNFGTQLISVDSTHIDVRFYSFATAAGGVTSWSSYTSYKWRLRLSASGQPTGFAAATNTARGLMLDRKQYVVGTAYTNGTPAVTCPQAGWTVVRGVLIPYQTYDGAWRLRLNIAGTFTSASVSSIAVTLSGTTFKNVTSYYQPVFGMLNNGSSTGLGESFVTPNTGNITVQAPAAGSASQAFFSGDIELDSKPTWAD